MFVKNWCIFYWALSAVVLRAEVVEEGFECIDVSKPSYRTFESMLNYQENKISFDARKGNFQGNYVKFNGSGFGPLSKNAFVTFDSNYIIKLSLDNKQISDIQGNAFLSLFCLEILELQGNSIKNVSRYTFAGLENLEELNLSENLIEEISEFTFRNNKKLRLINLSRNQIKVVYPESFFNLSSLVQLDLSHNFLKEIPAEAFQYFVALDKLELSSNKLLHVEPEKWRSLQNLSILNLGDNSLVSFDTGFNFAFVSLTHLFLNENHLTKLNAFNMRKHLPELQFIDLNDNPWYCEDLKTIMVALNDSRIKHLGNNHTSDNENGIACSLVKIPYSKPTENPEEPTEATTTSTTEASPSLYPSFHLTNEEILRRISNLYTLVVFLFIFVVVFVAIDVTTKSGVVFRLCSRRRDAYVLDNSNVENIALLR